MRRCILVVLVVAFMATGAHAEFRIGAVTPDVIYGSGNVNEAWTVYLGYQGTFVEDVEIGQRAKLGGENTYNMDAGGFIYYHQTGSPDGTAANWNFDFSVNVDVPDDGVLDLSNTRIELSIGATPDMGIGPFYYYDIFSAFTGNEVGTATTANGGGLVYPSESGADLSPYTVVQNSLNIGELGLGFDVNAEADYDIVMSVYDLRNPNLSVKVCHAWMQVQVRDVPEPVGLAVLLPIVAVVLAMRRRSR